MSVGTYSLNQLDSYPFSSAGKVKTIDIADYSCRNIREFKLDSLSELETLTVGEHSFRYDLGEKTNGTFSVKNCPKLTDILIKHYAFEDFTSVELENLPSLRSFHVEHLCFRYVKSLKIASSR